MEPDSISYGNFTLRDFARAYALEQQDWEEGAWYPRSSAELPRHVVEVMGALYAAAAAGVVQAGEACSKIHEPQPEVTITRRLTVLHHE